MNKIKTYSRERPMKKEPPQEEVLDFDVTCRLCLLSINERLPIFNDFDTSIPSKITACTSIEIYENDGFPPNICLPCQKQLEISYKFQQKCQESHAKLCHIVNYSAYISERTEGSNLFLGESASSHGEHDMAVEACVVTDKTQDTLLQQMSNQISRDNTIIDGEENCVSSVVHNVGANDCTMNEDPDNINQNNECHPQLFEDCMQADEDAFAQSIEDEVVTRETEHIDLNSDREVVNVQRNTDNSITNPDFQNVDVEDSYDCSELTLVDSEQNDDEVYPSSSDEQCSKTESVRIVMNKSYKEKRGSFYFCNICPKRFRYESACDMHITRHLKDYDKSDASYFTCQVCNEIFKTQSSLHKHKITHVSRKYSCKICKKPFSQIKLLKKHIATHHIKTSFACGTCGKSYTQRDALRLHMMLVHPDDPEQISLHDCPICEKSFCYPSGLSRHLFVHSGKTYDCLTCDRKFTDSSALKRHAKTKNHEFFLNQ